MAVRIPLYLFSHHQKIAFLYRKFLRDAEGRNRSRINYIYEAVKIRAEFEEIYHEKDMRKSKEMLMEKERLFQETYIPIDTFPTSPAGVAYERTLEHDDSCLDYWHPLEKAAYPEYFARREIRKQQYLELWEKMHGPPKPDDYSGH